MQHEDIQAHQRLRQCFGRDLGHEASVNICNLSLCRKKTKQKSINTRDVAATSLRLVEAPPTEATVSHGDRTSRNSEPLDLWGAGIASTEQTRLLPPVLQETLLLSRSGAQSIPQLMLPRRLPGRLLLDLLLKRQRDVHSNSQRSFGHALGKGHLVMMSWPGMPKMAPNPWTGE